MFYYFQSVIQLKKEITITITILTIKNEEK